MDIPFIGYTIGWHNYKFVAKKELEKVPILGKSIKVAKNVLVDRSDRKSQLMTLKQGISWLEVSVKCWYCDQTYMMMRVFPCLSNTLFFLLCNRSVRME